METDQRPYLAYAVLMCVGVSVGMAGEVLDRSWLVYISIAWVFITESLCGVYLRKRPKPVVREDEQTPLSTG
jgi:hypothetical protein